MIKDNLLSLKICLPYLIISLGCSSQGYTQETDSKMLKGSFFPLEQETHRLKNKQIYNNSESQIEKAQRFLEDNSVQKNASQVFENSIADNTQLIHNVNIDFNNKKIDINFDNVIKKYIDKSLNKKIIFSLVTDLTQVLYEAGYSTSGISFKKVDAKTGTLDFLILWGKVDNILVNNKKPKSYKDKAMLYVLPNLKDKVFNIYDIDQLVEILNTTNQSAEIKVVASEEYGKSNLNIIPKVTRKLPILTIGMNNSGTENNANGRNQLNLNTAFSNLLGTNDSWALSMGYRLYKASKRNNQINFSIIYTQPFSFYTLDTKFSQSSYKKELSDVNTYFSEGITKTTSIKLTRSLFRNRESILSLYGELEFKFRKSSLSGLNIGNYRNHKFTTGLSYITNFLHGKLYTDLSYSNGLNWFHANKSSYNSSNDTTLKLLSSSITWYKPFQFFNKEMNYQIRSGAQYSFDSLYSDDQFSIGDEYSVRGFKGGIASGDSGAYISQTITIPFYPHNSFLTSVSPFVGFDFGKSYQKRPYIVKTLVGTAIGTKIQAGKFALSFTLGLPLITQNISYKKDNIYYVNGSYSF